MGFLDLFRPSYRHSDPKVRFRAVYKITNKALLLKIMASDKDLIVKVAAGGRLADLEGLSGRQAK